MSQLWPIAVLPSNRFGEFRRGHLVSLRADEESRGLPSSLRDDSSFWQFSNSMQRPRVTSRLGKGLCRSEAVFCAFGFLWTGSVEGRAQNRVLELDGQGSYVELPSNIFNDLDEATVEGWVKFQEFRTESRFFDFGTRGPGMYVTEDGATADLRFVIDEADGKPQQQIPLKNVLRLNEWCHLAAVSGREGMKLYVNGLLLGTNAFQGSFRSVMNGDHNYLGRNNWKGYFRGEDFRGCMDEIRVWRSARTQAQIRDNLFRRLTEKEDGLIGLWNFDDDTARDSSLSRHRGHFRGNAKSVADEIPTADELLSPALLYGGIIDETGQPLRGAMVALQQGETRIAAVSTDDSGEYRTVVYPAGVPLDLSAISGRRGDWQLNLRLESGEWRRADFRLGNANYLDGIVRTMDTNFFQAGVVVQAVVEVPSDRASAERGSEAPRSYVADTRRTDANGRFEFINLRPGRYQLRCPGGESPIYYAQGEFVQVEPGQSYRGFNFQFPPFKQGIWRSYTLLDGLKNDDVRDIHFDSEGALWLATWGGAARYDGVGWMRLTKNDGLPDNHVNTIAQDATGGMWLATEAGLAYFENHRFTQTDELVGRPIRALLVAADGSIWIGTPQGILRYDGRDWAKIDREAGLPGTEVNCIEQAPDGALWFGTNEGVLRYDGKQLKNFTQAEGLAVGRVTAIHLDADGVRWFGGARGVTRYDGRTVSHLTERDGLMPGVVQAIRRDTRGALWIGVNGRPGTSEGGVTRFDGEASLGFTTADGLAGNGVRAIRVASDGEIWFATDAGASRFDKTAFRNFTAKDGLPDNKISKLQAFPDGTIWCWRVEHGFDEFHWPKTDPGDGITRYDGRSFHTFTTADGLAGDRVSSVYRDPSGMIWLTGHGGISRSNGPRLERISTGEEWLGDGGISIHRDPDGTMWFSRHNGVSRYSGDNLEDFSAGKVFENQHFTDMHRTSDGILWLGTLNQGLWSYDGKRFWNSSTNQGLPSETIYSIDEAPDGTLWFRTGRGLGRYDGKGFTAFATENGSGDGRVTALCVDPDGAVWAGTAGAGVLCYRAGRLTSFTSAGNRLAHDKINTIYLDADGVHWFGTDGGVSQFNGLSWSSFNPRDGLAGNRVHAIAQDAQGDYWFGTDRGLTRYRRSSARPNKPALTMETGKARRPGEIPSVTAGERVTLKFDVVDLKNQPQNRKFRYRIQAASPSIRDHGEWWSPPAIGTHIEWATNRVGCYTIAVQYIDRDLRTSEPAVALLNIVPPWYLNGWVAVPSGLTLFGLIGSITILRSRYHRKREESLRLRETMFEQEHRARLAMEAKNAQLEAARQTAEEARQAADRANKSKSLFLANMSHEIRTPMNAILGYADILHTQPLQSPKLRHGLGIIQKSGDDLMVLIDEILDLSKIEAGKMELHVAEFDLNTLLEDLSLLFKVRCRQKNLAWRLERAGSPPKPASNSVKLDGDRSTTPGDGRRPPLHAAPGDAVHDADSSVGLRGSSPWNRGLWVQGDAPKLRRVLLNLLVNATKFTAGGSVTLRVTAGIDHRYAFEVIDTGRGISPDKQKQLFEPFGEMGESTEASGTGLGLAISKQIVDLMQGALQLESEPGRGSRFFFSLELPMADAPVCSALWPSRARARHLASGVHVQALVVDDRLGNREVLCEMLSQIGCAVSSANDGGEALDAVRANLPDIAFIDIRMPGMNGIETAQRIIEEFGREKCKLVSFSASALAHERQACLDAGFHEVLSKPLRLERLCESLARLLKVEFEEAPDAPPDALKAGDAVLSRPSDFANVLAALKRAAEQSNATQIRSCLQTLEQFDSEGRQLADRVGRHLEHYDFKAIMNSISEIYGAPFDHTQ